MWKLPPKRAPGGLVPPNESLFPPESSLAVTMPVSVLVPEYDIMQT